MIAHPNWPAQAIIIQPWGDAGNEDRYVKDFPRHAARMKAMGFDAVCFIPPPGHNDLYKRHYTDKDFARAVQGYQRAGIKVLIYACHLHVGHHPRWHQLVREHPAWRFRDQHNEPVRLFGDYLLCPNNEPAFVISLAHTLDLVRRFQPDGILMDNNSIYGTVTRHFCYCAGCRAKFGDYIQRQYTRAAIRRLFQVDPDRIQIPRKRNLLYEEWIDWQYAAVRAWTRRTTLSIRRLKPDCMVVCNTFYGMEGNGFRGSDDQCDFEDAIISENNLSAFALILKTKHAFAIGGGIPVWQYMTTWKNLRRAKGAKTKLADTNYIKAGLAAILGFGAHPWIVSYGLNITAKRIVPQAQAMAGYFRFYRRHRDCYLGSVPYSRLGLLFSRQTRDHSPLYYPRPDEIYRKVQYAVLIKNHAWSLMEMKVPFDIVVEKNLLQCAAMQRYDALLVPEASCLSDRDVRALKQYVRSGGRLITTAFTGACDELGRRRSKAWCRSIFERCNVRHQQSMVVGKGEIVFLPFLSPGDDIRLSKGYMFAGSAKFGLEDQDNRMVKIKEQLGAAGSLLVVTNCPMCVSISTMRQQLGKKTRYILHVINRAAEGHLKDIGISLVPERWFVPRRVTVLSPDKAGRIMSVPFTWRRSRGVSFVLPDLKVYSLIVVE